MKSYAKEEVFSNTAKCPNCLSVVKRTGNWKDMVYRMTYKCSCGVILKCAFDYCSKTHMIMTSYHFEHPMKRNFVSGTYVKPQNSKVVKSRTVLNKDLRDIDWDQGFALDSWINGLAKRTIIKVDFIELLYGDDVIINADKLHDKLSKLIPFT